MDPPKTSFDTFSAADDTVSLVDYQAADAFSFTLSKASLDCGGGCYSLGGPKKLSLTNVNVCLALPKSPSVFYCAWNAVGLVSTFYYISYFNV